MLAGEYGVIIGSEAITVPLTGFHAKLSDIKDAAGSDQEKIHQSVSGLRKVITYIESLPRNSFFANPEIRDLQKLLKDGYFIHSTIPQGYGIGSSGAVSALIYDQFFSNTGGLTLEEQRKDLASIESCFHGKSSGVDAMTCFKGSALHFLPGGKIKLLEKDPLHNGMGYRFFLLDSKETFDTGPLVTTFMEQMKKNDYAARIRSDYFTLISKFINSVTGTSGSDPALIFRAISDFQFSHFRPMIPENMEEAWINGQVSNVYYLKLNGSGGGFMLGIAHEDSRELVESMLNNYSLYWL